MSHTTPDDHDWRKRVAARVQRWAAPKSALESLALLRVGVALVLLCQVAVVAPYLDLLYGERGIIQWRISDAIVPKGLPTISDLAWLLGKFAITPAITLRLAMATQVLALFGLLLGWQTRLCATVAWLTDCLLSNAAGFTVYGFSSFSRICLSYCMLFPVGERLALGRPGLGLVSPGVALRVLQGHLLLIYLSSGVEKALGMQWWTGEAIWRSLMQPIFYHWDFSWLAHHPRLAMAASIGTLVIEAGYVFFALAGFGRVWAFAALGLHASIAVFMGLKLFAGIMIVLNVAAFLGNDVWRLAAALQRTLSSRYLSLRTRAPG